MRSRPHPSPRDRTRPLVVVDARALQRPGIGFHHVLVGILEELGTAPLSVVLVTDDGLHGESLRDAYPAWEVAILRRTSWLWWEQVQLARLLWSLRPDVLIAPTNYGVPLVRPRCTRSLLVLHDLIPLRFPRTYLASRPMWAAMYLVSTGLALVSASRIVAVSDASARDLWRFAHRSAVVIYPPLPQQRPVDTSDRSRPEAYFLFNGGFDSRKNVPALLDALSIFRAEATGQLTTLVVLGDRGELIGPMVQERSLEDAVRVTGYVDDGAKWEWVSQATAIVYPSSYEGFGLVLAEGFAAGVPVIAGTGGALREVGGSAVLPVDPGRPESIAAAMSESLRGEVRDRLVAEGRLQLEHLRVRTGGWSAIVADLAGTSGE